MSEPQPWTPADDLVLFITSDGQIYGNQVEPLLAQLSERRRKAQGTVEGEVTLWLPIVERALIQYRREVGPIKLDFKQMLAVAKDLQDHYAEELNAMHPARRSRRNPGRGSVHTKKWDDCYKKVKKKGGAYNAAAVCTAALGERGSIRPGHRHKNPAQGSFAFALRNKKTHRLAYYTGKNIRNPLAFNTERKLAKRYDTAARAQAAYRMLIRNGRAHFAKGFIPEVVDLRTRKNPAAEGEKLYSGFHGEPAKRLITHKLPRFARGVEVGPVVEITYDTKRDGKILRFRHKFKRSASPLLIVSDDGRKLALTGGDIQFTDRGIEDR